jgi:hypothetical protein
MAADFGAVFVVLKPVLKKYETHMSVQADTPVEYTLVTKAASPFPQHKGHGMYFGSVRLGKAYVSFHLMPLYMCEELTRRISPLLKKHMQGKTCFNFKKTPEPELTDELARLTAEGFEFWREKKWLE